LLISEVGGKFSGGSRSKQFINLSIELFSSGFVNELLSE